MKNKKLLIGIIMAAVTTLLAIVLIVLLPKTPDSSDFLTLDILPAETDADGKIAIPQTEESTSENESKSESKTETESQTKPEIVAGTDANKDGRIDGDDLFESTSAPDSGIVKELMLFPRVLFQVSKDVEVKRGQHFFDFEEARDDSQNSSSVTYNYSGTVKSKDTGYQYREVRAIINLESDYSISEKGELEDFVKYISNNGIPFYFNVAKLDSYDSPLIYIIYKADSKSFGFAAWLDNAENINEEAAIKMFEDFYCVKYIMN